MTSTDSFALPRTAREPRFGELPPVGSDVEDGAFDGGAVGEITEKRFLRRNGRYYGQVSMKSGGDVCSMPEDYLDGWISDEDGVAVDVSYDQKVRVYFSGALPDSVQYRPRTLFFGANGYFKRLRWSSWGGRVARARGLVPYNDCNPYCAAGHVTFYPARFRLSRPRLCAGRYRYATLRSRIVGNRLPPHGKRTSKQTFDFVCTYDD